ncbi:unnamed protein product [Parnassius apollo]|uniref:(apollo) hypothetical protein n=1 Tax=Parnassius apollo TaxID=110799 RepID=A0A8S3WHQ7_PARAO|nr:unnamed protein product [Parnassius apollo]
MPKEIPIKEAVMQESEASGSDSFQEYGPPKVQEVSQDLSNQGLPDAEIEQTFAAVDLKVEQNEEKEVAVAVAQAATEEVEGKVNQKSISEEIMPVTETLVIVESTTLTAESDIITEVQPAFEVITQVTDESSANVINTETEITQEEDASLGTEPQKLVNQLQQKSVELTQQENENANSEIVTTFEQRVQEEEIQTVAKEVEKIETEVKQVKTEVEKIETQVQNVESESKAVKQEIQNVPELLINLDNEIKKQQAENIQEIAKVTLETFGSLEQAPEGFLEYGPPGFKEYGPPKDELRSTAEEIKPELQSIKINETRKRRFSPKFRITSKANKP